MCQRLLAVCFFALLVFGNGLPCEAGGFLRRLFGRGEARMPSVASTAGRVCMPAARPMNLSPAGVAYEGAAPTRAVYGDDSTKMSKSARIAHVPMNPDQEFDRNCRACEAVYANPAHKKKCKEIAKILRDKMKQKDYVAYIPDNAPCACQFPEFPTGEVCMTLYDLAVNSPDPHVRECAVECFIACVLTSAAFLETTEDK
jgi:hypothetical protein